MKLYQCLIALFIISLVAFGAPKYPFPQAVKYKYGIMPAKISNDKVQAVYADFNTRLYAESGEKARIKYDDTTLTVSEGIAYGMIIMVYMDNATNNTQTKFDKLWKYYNSFLDSKGLMNWQITGFSTPTAMGQNAATDADLDVAVALVEAYKQWGDEKYLTDAKKFIKLVWKYEIDSVGGVLPGDSWGMWAATRNPSYFNPPGFQLFKNADSSNWNKVLTNTYSLLMKARNATTGLLPAWCSTVGVPDAGDRGTFQYDAIRVPWRMSWAYCWYGHDTAKTVSSGIASWITTKTSGDPGKVVDGYNLDGSPTAKGKYNNGTFLGCLASAGMVDSKHQAWLDAAYSRLQDTLGPQKEVYFSQSIKLMNLLLLSGNMPDFWNMPVSIASPENAAFNGKTLSAPKISWDSRNGVLTLIGAQAGYSVDIFNSSGRLAARPYCGRSEGGLVNLSLAKLLQPGVYWARLNAKAGSAATRMIIDR
jgi:endoglucanase